MRGRPPKAAAAKVPEKVLNTYRMEALGYDFAVTGNWLKDQLEIEFACFRIGHERRFGGLGKFGHFKRIVDLLWNNPELECQKRFVWNPWAERMLRKACDPAIEELGVAGPTSAGKCTRVDTPILMHDGSIRRADEIKPGDAVMGDDSGPRIVQEVHRGRSPLYKITPERGDPWYCTGNHKLVLKRTFASKKSWRRVADIVEIEAEEFSKKSNEFRRSHKQFCVGVEFPEKQVPFDPRLLGIWLGDGHYHHCRISIPTQEPEVLTYVSQWAEANDYRMTELSGCPESCPTYQIFPRDRSKGFQGSSNPLRQFLKSTIVSEEKRIPELYLKNCKQVRMDLLAGLLDTDGYADKTGFEIATKYDGLKDDIVFLARSLGFRVSATHRMVKLNGGYFPSWRIYISGNVSEVPTLRKKPGEKTLRKNSDCVGIKVELSEEDDWVGFSVDGNHRFLLGDFTVTHNSDPFALWVVVNYIADPTHVKGLIMSTTLDGAKLRIWKSVREYIEALPDFPGKKLWSTNRICGPTYDGTSFGESSGLLLLASEKSREKEALERLIGIKSPRTGTPDYSFEGLKRQFADLVPQYDEDTLRDILPLLANLSEHRIGKLILVVDEATGLPESLLSAIRQNMKPGNVGSLQVIMLGNPSLHWDSFGRFCEPMVGWDNVTVADEEWETVTGGTVIRFNGEKNPRITEKNDLYSWMLTQQRIEDIARDCGGKDSLGYWRMVLGMWSPEGSESGIYSQGDVEAHGAMSKAPVVWGFERPSLHSSLDASFSIGGDRAFVTFGKLGKDPEGKKILERTGTKVLEIDISKDTEIPVNFQIVRKWKAECERRGIPPENCCFDSSGAGLVFGDIVVTQWSPLVQGITAGGKPLKEADPVVKKEKDGTERSLLFANRATQLWYTAHPYFRAGQIRGVSPSLAKEICSRQLDPGHTGDGRTLKIEGKKDFKVRLGHSPDESDSFFLMVEHCRAKHGFKSADKAAPVEQRSNANGKGSWNKLKERAMRLHKSHRGNLRR